MQLKAGTVVVLRSTEHVIFLGEADSLRWPASAAAISGGALLPLLLGMEWASASPSLEARFVCVAHAV